MFTLPSAPEPVTNSGQAHPETPAEITMELFRTDMVRSDSAASRFARLFFRRDPLYIQKPSLSLLKFFETWFHVA